MQVEYPGAFIDETPATVPPIAPAHSAVTAIVGSFATGPVRSPTPVHSLAQFKQLFADSAQETVASRAAADFFANGGRRAVIARATTRDALPTTTELLEALSALAVDARDLPLAQLLCIPDMGRRVEPFSQADYAVLVGTATKFCVDQRMFLLVDPNTQGDTPSDIEQWLGSNPTVGSANCAIYFPRLMARAGHRFGDGTAAASPLVAGVMARTDEQRGVWKAPAGPHAILAAEPAYAFSDLEQSPLNRQGVNVIRAGSGKGSVIWGSRTGVGSIRSDWRYVQVRRLLLFVEHSVQRGLQWIRPETNDAALWASIEASVEDFLEQLWRRGAFLGARADEAFYVRCDSSTMTRVDLRRGRTVIEVGVAARRPAEFVSVGITILR